ncbi:MAG: hypothetical protein CMO01_26775 [Thalassobius sp.]|nr:hypothetical protein [Thalassovita sp.]
MEKGNHTTENALLNSVSKGSHKSFELFYNEYSKLVFGYAFKSLKCKSEADDIVQQTFTRIWENREKLAEIRSPKDYVFIISRNLIFSRLKLKFKDESLSEELKLNVQLMRQRACDEELIYSDIEKIAKAAIEALPKQRKLIFKLSKEQHYTQDEIAEHLSISKNTVKESLRKAYQQIRKDLMLEPDFTMLISFLIVSIQILLNKLS